MASTLTPPSRHFYPRPPRGGRPDERRRADKSIPRFLSTPSARRATQMHCIKVIPTIISIHALREEGDAEVKELRSELKISIHALREEGDFLILRSAWAACPYFYPRPPRGGRPMRLDFHATTAYFYPRPPRGGRPRRVPKFSIDQEFLSTPSARRATPALRRSVNLSANFYPRPPRGGRRLRPRSSTSARTFLSTPSARRATYRR